MKLLLERIYNCKSYCIGHLYDVTNGKKNFICDTLEDTDRGLSDSMSADYIKKLKVYGKTAIPCGEYNVNLNIVSPKFSKKQFYMDVCNGQLPRLEKVKGFEGILIHVGNTHEDSEGCILVGENKVVGKVINSKLTFEKLMIEYFNPCKKNNKKITIEIKRKYKI
jgi:hypothetical protein